MSSALEILGSRALGQCEEYACASNRSHLTAVFLS